MRFAWTYHDEVPIKVRTFLGMNGVTRSLLVVAKYHGGDILLNGDHVWTVNLMHTGDTVTLVLPNEEATDRVDSCSAPIDIIYEDDDYLILNKPAGVATVPAHHVVTADSLVNRVKGYYQRMNYPDQVTHVATRLDKDTSGIVIFPKHRFAHAVIDQQLKQHRVVKKYQAITSGVIPANHGLIEAALERDPDSFVKRQVGTNGKYATTEYWVKQRFTDATLVDVMLHTGRTHQIRVHFNFLGHPLIGDQMYEGPTGLERQALHCYYVKFFSRFKNQYIELTCELADDMKAFLMKKV
ncbi:RluA family pseudouridine synthase [Paucilactobacillus nenjiangensis]